MYVKLVLVLVVFCAVIIRTKCERSYDGRPYMHKGYARYKGKYYSSPPQRYNRRPQSSPLRASSYIPNYTTDDEELQHSKPANPRPRYQKVNKRPIYDDSNEDDINNIVKNLSKEDLDKIIDLASEKDNNERYSKDPYEIEYSSSKLSMNDFKTASGRQDRDSDKYSVVPLRDDENKLFKALVQEIDLDQDPKPFNVEYSKPSRPVVNYVTLPTPLESNFAESQSFNNFDAAALAAEESKLKNQIAYLKSQINDGVVYTDSEVMPEENLPKPMNLREDDHEVSYSNNVPTVVRADPSSSYKLENFGDLPLMNFNSKLDTLSSYHVPHYTVTSAASLSPTSLSSSYSAPPPTHNPAPYGPSLEHAPPPSVAKAQSDAHLKAVRIWSHKSRGTAYTLHDDGSLSLDLPSRRSKGSYGPYKRHTNWGNLFVSENTISKVVNI